VPLFKTIENEETDMRVAVSLTALVFLAASALAQDPVKVDPQHYKVDFENAKVRVLRAKYGPHEKSPMHQHPDAVAIYVTDVHGQFTMPDGSTQKTDGKAGQALWTPAGKHAPENLGDKPFEVIIVELKGGGAAKGAATAKPADKTK
jgi:quercetin dioxygenase-like cupin family protein